MAFEFVLVMGVIAASLTGTYARLRLSFLGLFAVATLLYMEASSAFLTAQSVGWYNIAPQLHTIRAVTAGKYYRYPERHYS